MIDIYRLTASLVSEWNQRLRQFASGAFRYQVMSGATDTISSVGSNS